MSGSKRVLDIFWFISGDIKIYYDHTKKLSDIVPWEEWISFPLYHGTTFQGIKRRKLSMNRLTDTNYYKNITFPSHYIHCR